MRPLRALAIYLAVVFLGGALLAPWVYKGAQGGGPVLAKAASKPFPRFVVNSFLVLAVVGIWPFFKALGAESPREMGLPSPAGRGGQMLKGVALGLISLAPVVVLGLAAGGRGWAEGLAAGKVTGKLIGAVFTAAGVSVLEEILFRGGIYGGLRRVFDWRFALVLSSGVFAATHFLEEPNFHDVVTWSSGLELLPRMGSGFLDIRALVPGFFSLALAGALLALVYQRTGDLYFAMGLHAGWIFWLAAYRVFTVDIVGSSSWFWGTSKLIDGWLAFVALAATLVLVGKYMQTDRERH